jgi:hypothetical protein
LLQLAESGCEVGSTLEHRRVRDVYLDEPCLHAIAPKEVEGHVIFVVCCDWNPKSLHRLAEQVVTRALGEPLTHTSSLLDGIADDRHCMTFDRPSLAGSGCALTGARSVVVGGDADGMAALDAGRRQEQGAGLGM